MGCILTTPELRKSGYQSPCASSIRSRSQPAVRFSIARPKDYDSGPVGGHEKRVVHVVTNHLAGRILFHRARHRDRREFRSQHYHALNGPPMSWDESRRHRQPEVDLQAFSLVRVSEKPIRRFSKRNLAVLRAKKHLLITGYEP